MKKLFNILCYGDSNTWGYVANSIDSKTYYMERYPRTTRWPGLLQATLGKQFHVIEEGLNARTTNVDYEKLAGHNGKTYLHPCLYSHAPLDLVIICLGVNDFKAEFNRSANDILNGLEELIDIIQRTTFGADMRSAPQVLLINNCLLSNENYQDIKGEFIFEGAIAKGRELLDSLPKLAIDKGCEYLDATDIAFSLIDGIHYDADGHRQLAEQVVKKVKQII